MTMYDEATCHMTGLSPLAVIVADRILLEQARGSDFTQSDIALRVGMKVNDVAKSIKELRSMGMMDEGYDLAGYRNVVAIKDQAPTIGLMELARKVVAEFNKLHEEDPNMPTYKENNQAIINWIKALLSDSAANDLVKGLDKFESLFIRIKAVLDHRWALSNSGGWVDKKYVRPPTLLRSASKFYDTYVPEARSYYIAKNKGQ